VGLPKPLKRTEKSRQGKLIPGEFSQFENELSELGIRLNQNLLRTFYAAGVERVRQAIAYLKDRLQKAQGSIARVAGYLVTLIQDGENLVEEVNPQANERALFYDWFDRQREKGVVHSTWLDEETKEPVVVFHPKYSERLVRWREAMALAPLDS
jgi:hypothetical protein